MRTCEVPSLPWRSSRAMTATLPATARPLVMPTRRRLLACMLRDLPPMIWRFEHSDVNRTTIELLDLRASHDVLEVGSGPGVALREVAARVPLGRALGVDVSEGM